MTKFVLKYPETVIPPVVIESESGSVAVDENDNVVSESEENEVNNLPFED